MQAMNIQPVQSRLLFRILVLLLYCLPVLSQAQNSGDIDFAEAGNVAANLNEQALYHDNPKLITADAETGMEFVFIKPGCFNMGRDDVYSYADEQPVHRVCVAQGFYLGKYEVTQAQWQNMMGYNPSRFSRQQAPCGKSQLV